MISDMDIRDRIVELRRVKASELKPHPKNWRTHPVEQQDAMRGILAEVGIADAVLARETDDGLQLIDGHLRAEIAPDTEWPVLVLDVNEEEAKLILATHDPLAAMADINMDMLTGLVTELEIDNDEIQSMLADLMPPDFLPVGIDEQGRLDEKAKVTCPECGHEF